MCKNLCQKVLTCKELENRLSRWLHLLFLKAVIFADFCLFCAPTVPLSHFRYPKTKALVLIIGHLYLQIVTSASASDFKVVVLIGINERNIPSKVIEGYPFIYMDALDKKVIFKTLFAICSNHKSKTISLHGWIWRTLWFSWIHHWRLK